MRPVGDGAAATQDARDRYHVATLALFNVRLLARLQHEDDPVVRDLIADEIRLNGLRGTPSLLHQAAFLPFAYTCLVWLWESAKRAKLEDDLLKQFPDTARRLGLQRPSESRIVGERDLDDWRDVLRLLRNALGHGRVEMGDEVFVFSDQNTYGKNPELAPTFLTLTRAELAKVSESVLHSLTPVLWPKSD